MLIALLGICSKEELEEEEIAEEAMSPTTDDLEHRKKAIKSKIMAVGKMSRVFAVLRYAVPCFSSLSPSLT